MSTDQQRVRMPDPVPAIGSFKHKEVWTARDAARMRDLMAQRMASPLGELHLVSLDRELLGRRGRITHDDTLAARQRLAPLRRDIVAGWRDPDSPTILASTDFAQMMLGAAVTTPDAPLHPQEIIAASGVVFFAEKQSFADLPLMGRAVEDQTASEEQTFAHLGVRALSWFTTAQGPTGGLDGLMLELYTDGPDAQYYEEVLFPMNTDMPLQPLAAYHHLYTLSSGFGHVGGTAEQYSRIHPSVRVLMALVRALSAIARSPQTEETADAVETPVQRRSRIKRHKRAPRDVRVLSLHHAEHGRYELDAATGRKVRAHWVRGHWRNQWYASTQEHHTIWIDGFVRGDGDLGLVTGPKVYLA